MVVPTNTTDIERLARDAIKSHPHLKQQILKLCNTPNPTSNPVTLIRQIKELTK